MNEFNLNSISPIDGRYSYKTEVLRQYFSEKALIYYRLKVEIEYFISLCKLGIPQLKQEESFSASFGVTAKIPDANLTLTADAFFTGVDDRVVLTGNFSIPDGIVTDAIFLTVGILLSLLVAYRSGYIKPTENFKLGIFAATGGIAIVYLVNFVMGFFGSSMGIMQIDNASPMSIGFSVVVVIIAALNLVLDFDFIEEGAEKGAPKYMEWYGAFGLLVTLIWLYLEILRLLAKLNSRR